MYLKSLRIERFRAFERTEVRLHYPGAAASEGHKFPNVNVLLGNNGMGKSAALKAAAIALMSPVIASTGYRPFSLVRREAGRATGTAVVEAHVAVTEQDLDGEGHTPHSSILGARILRRRTTETCEPYAKAADPVWDAMYEETSAALFFVGYGVSRTVESQEKADSSLRRRSRHLRYERVAGLFEEQTTLMPLAAWLPRLRTDRAHRYQEVVTLLTHEAGRPPWHRDGRRDRSAPAPGMAAPRATDRFACLSAVAVRVHDAQSDGGGNGRVGQSAPRRAGR